MDRGIKEEYGANNNDPDGSNSNQDANTASYIESEASALLRSELLEHGHVVSSSEQSRPASTLQQKLYKVKNVFSAIRENLNEQSSAQTHNSEQSTRGYV